MRVLRGPHRVWDRVETPTAVTVGVYDGVHLGHLAVLDAMRANADGAPLGVVTFADHPAALLAPDRVPPLLTSLDQKLEQLEAAGVEFVGLLDFDDMIASMSAAEFAREVVADAMAATLVVVGSDFRFGYRRHGDLAELERLGTRLGFRVLGLDLRTMSGDAVSSSRIRGMVANGDVVEAARLLGRPFAMRGPVVPGDGRGRTIGVPTANVAVDPTLVEPARGVYAVWTSIGGARLPGVVNVGVRPTFGGTGDDTVVEVHVLDFAEDLYGRVIEVAFVDRIRTEKRFRNAGHLVAQIQRDIATAKERLGERR